MIGYWIIIAICIVYILDLRAQLRRITAAHHTIRIAATDADKSERRGCGPLIVVAFVIVIALYLTVSAM